MQLHPAPLHRAAAQNLQALFAVCLLLFAVFFSQPVTAHDRPGGPDPFDVQIKVWSTQSFDDPFCSDDPIDIYFRVNRVSYITVYQINPYGGVDILYPLSCHRWQPVYPGRTYRLIDLAADLNLLYHGEEGNAYIGVVATQYPIDIVPWLEAGFRERGLGFGRPARVSVGVDFRLVIDRVLADVRVRLGSACAPAYYVAPIYVRPRVVRYRPPVVVWPTPPRHQSHYPKGNPPSWGHHDDDHYRSTPEPQEKRPIRRRGNEGPEDRYRVPDSGKTHAGGRSASDPRSVKRDEEVKVKNESKDSRNGESSSNPDRRVKKPRN